MEQHNQQPNRFLKWLKASTTSRLLMIGFLSIILMIPLSFIEDLIQERSYRQKAVINEINEQWGNEVAIYGPIFKIPYKTFSEKTIVDEKTKKVTTETIEHIKYGYFFPDDLAIQSEINPEEKQRGIYTTAVYNSTIKIKGSFTKFNFGKIEVKNKDILWNKSKILLKTSNVKGVNTALQVKLNDKVFLLSSTSNKGKYDKFYTLETDLIDIEEAKKLNNTLKFTIDFNVKGSTAVRFIPVGKTTTARINSNWQTANFNGAFLPYNSDKVHKDGFNAKWKVLAINRAFGQQHFNNLPELNEFDFGVNFKIPVDEYQKSARSAKYGFLVICLTFLIFFLIQTVSKINVHPFQYLMIGLSLVMFYTLLVSISEHSNFLKAYAIAGSSVITLITFYARSILKNIKFSLIIFISLLILYSFIFIIIQLESYALLVGSIGLFLILASVMLISRKIDWSK